MSWFLKRIGCYLKQASDQEMVMNPSSNVCKIDTYPNAGFPGIYNMVMRIIQIHLCKESQRIHQLLQSVLCYGNQNCKQRQLYL